MPGLALARTLYPARQLLTSGALPASGEYQDIPSSGAVVPSDALRAFVQVKYTRSPGVAGGKAAVKVYRIARKDNDTATIVSQSQAADGSYDGTELVPSTSDTPIWCDISVDVEGASGIAIACAEVGATATPGTVEAWVSFQ